MLSDELKKSLTECLKELHLPTVRACYEEEADRARRESLTYEYYLAEVMQRDITAIWFWPNLSILDQ